MHESGLPAFRIYVDTIQKEQKLFKLAKNEPLINEVVLYVYSDLGMIHQGET